MKRALFASTLLAATLGAAVPATEVVPSAAGAPAPLHFELKKSSPEAGTTVERVTEVRLWFTQEPQDGTTSIRVIDADGKPVPTGEVAADPEDDTSFGVAVGDALPAGRYTVAWRAMGQDGHVVRDDFTFAVVES